MRATLPPRDPIDLAIRMSSMGCSLPASSLGSQLFGLIFVSPNTARLPEPSFHAVSPIRFPPADSLPIREFLHSVPSKRNLVEVSLLVPSLTLFFLPLNPLGIVRTSPTPPLRLFAAVSSKHGLGLVLPIIFLDSMYTTFVHLPVERLTWGLSPPPL